MSEIRMIELKELHPHPDNPRKDLGDLTELAASIKENGIYQNLTVVPNMVVGEITGQTWQRGYRIVIGHRRAAAAELAGVKDVPCIIAEMTPREEVAVMLLENMQRSDLTPYEEAEGFQLMFDFGETVESVAKQTGLSASTVRRRKKLLDLDRTALKGAVERGATLLDLEKVAKIRDEDSRKELMAALGTGNFTWKLNAAKSQQEDAANKERWRAFLKGRAEEDDTAEVSEQYRYIASVPLRGECDDSMLDPDYKIVYRFTVYGDVRFFMKVAVTLTEEAAAEKRKQEERDAAIVAAKDELTRLSEAAYRSRYDFVRSVTESQCREHFGEIVRHLAGLALIETKSAGYNNPYRQFGELLGEDLSFGVDYTLDLKWDEQHRIALENLTAAAETYRGLFFLCYLVENDSGDMDYWTEPYKKYPVYNGNYRLDRLYDFLAVFGYEMSDEEKALRDGSHEIFGRNEDESLCDG